MAGLRSRLLPALLTALGVTLLAGGLLSYTTPVTADTDLPPTPEPTEDAGDPSPIPLITLPPLGSAAPSAEPSAPADRVATRVRVAALDIDLPIIEPDSDDYPLCDVAMWIPALAQPGQGRATYLYAHARDGMFLPLLEQSRKKNGKKMLGMVVEVWTSDDQKFLYEITEVRRHEKTLDDALEATEEELWLQTSEGPKGTVGKLQVLAKPLSQETADHKAAHPKAKPVVCG
jgi:Sortase domain